ncbi:MAG: aldo/keto reductase [Magnetococcales bacterium]|nr:aldo/keto reductase [Magnetococcales bacterium]
MRNPTPSIIYGTAWKKEQTASLVEEALRAGFRGVDTACQPKHYHEAGVGQGIATSLARGIATREELYLQTKFTPLPGQDPQSVPYDPHAALPEQIRQSLQVSLKNLQTPWLDCLLLHSPLPTVAQTLEAWQTLEELVSSGKAKQIGISNCYDPRLLEHLYNTARIKPAVVQNRLHAATGYDQTIRAFCIRQDISYQSFWTLTANPHILEHPVVQALSGQYQRTPAQIFLRHLTQNGVTPLTGTTSPIHMREDLAIGTFQLTAAECHAIDALM